jgi:hypothetical protein
MGGITKQSAAMELRRRFPGIMDNAKAREQARAIAGWQPLQRGLPGAPGRRRQMPLPVASLLPLALARSGGVLPRAAAAPFSTDARFHALHRHGRRLHGTPVVPKPNRGRDF